MLTVLLVSSGCEKPPKLPPQYTFEIEELTIPIFASWVNPSGVIFAGAGSSLYTSANGTVWEQVNAYPEISGFIRTVFIDSRGTIFTSAMADGRLLMSQDQGKSWGTSLTFQTKHCVAWRMSEDNLNGLYVGEYTNGETLSERVPPQVYRSSDGGRTWKVILREPKSRHAHFVEADPYHDGMVYSAFGDGEGAVLYRSNNYGEDWVSLGSGSTFWQPTAVVFTENHRIWGMDSYADELYLSKDDKEFRRVHRGSDPRDWFWGMRTGNAIYFGSIPGGREGKADILASLDEGETWIEVYSLDKVMPWCGFSYISNQAPDDWTYSGDGTLENAIRFRLVKKEYQSGK